MGAEGRVLVAVWVGLGERGSRCWEVGIGSAVAGLGWRVGIGALGNMVRMG